MDRLGKERAPLPRAVGITWIYATKLLIMVFYAGSFKVGGGQLERITAVVVECIREDVHRPRLLLLGSKRACVVDARVGTGGAFVS